MSSSLTNVVPLWLEAAATRPQGPVAAQLVGTLPVESSGDRGWPSWLSGLALWDLCSVQAIQAVAKSAGAEVSRDAASALLLDMKRAGLFIEPGVAGGYLLREEVAGRWRSELAGLASSPDGFERVGRQASDAGLKAEPRNAGAKLAGLALDLGDWAGAELVWRLYPSAELVADPSVRDGYAGLPSEVRGAYPGLSIAASIASSYASEPGRLDLDRMVTALVRDGGTIHRGWQEHQAPDAKLTAGTLCLLAHAVMNPAELDGPAAATQQIYARLAELVQGSPVTGRGPSVEVCTLFHAVVALVRLLGGDLRGARNEAERALMLTEGCALPAFVAAAVIGLSSTLAGDAQSRSVAEEFLAFHAAHECGPRAWIEPALCLMRAEDALRALDAVGVRRHLQSHVDQAAASRWLAAPALHAAILGRAAVLWEQDPDEALARFDSLVPGLGRRGKDRDPWTQLLLTCRTQLLLALGARSHPTSLLFRAATGGDEQCPSAVAKAWVGLYTGRFSEALTAAEEGIFESRGGLGERAFLYALKSAALSLVGAADQLVASAARAACLLCGQAGTLLPLALLPAAVRSRLVEQHAKWHDEPDCLIADADRRGLFDQLADTTLVLSSPLHLTRREEVLLPLLATAATIPEIASQQFVSVNTLRKQVVTLRQKFGANTRDDLVRKAHEAGLLNRTRKA